VHAIANRILVGVLIALPHFLWGQEDTVQHIPEVRVNVSVQNIKVLRIRSPRSIITETDIRELGLQDAGEVVSKLSGVHLKSYGGLGGLKTVSVRAMGSQHTSIVVDGFSLANNQTGQINLGQIQTDNLVGAMLAVGEQAGLLSPISSQVAGSAIVLQTFENTFSRDTFQLRSNIKYGSFNQYNAYLAAKYNSKKWVLSTYGKYRAAKGNYAYDFQNGNSWEEGVRKNNDYQDYYYGGMLGFRGEKVSTARLGFKGSAIDQELPGAVILYNETADERLTTKDHILFGDAIWEVKKTSFRFYGRMNQNTLNYVDPTFLNNSGGVDVTYVNKLANAGLSFWLPFNSKFRFHGGLEQTVSALNSSDSLFSAPLRFHNHLLLGTYINLLHAKISVQVSSQYVNEVNRLAESAEDRFKVNPFMMFESISNDKYNWKHKLWYRNSFRMPSFNELYYNNIGNNILKPETAHQFNYGTELEPLQKRVRLYIRSNLFFNRVNNKIVAIPTKNLFVWSMQNVANVNIFGGEFMYTLAWKYKKWEISLKQIRF